MALFKEYDKTKATWLPEDDLFKILLELWEDKCILGKILVGSDDDFKLFLSTLEKKPDSKIPWRVFWENINRLAWKL